LNIIFLEEFVLKETYTPVSIKYQCISDRLPLGAAFLPLKHIRNRFDSNPKFLIFYKIMNIVSDERPKNNVTIISQLTTPAKF